MRIGIDARVGGGWSGGVEMVVLGLAQGFSKLSDGDEEYHFLVKPGEADWLEPFLGDNCRLLMSRAPKPERHVATTRNLGGRLSYWWQRRHERKLAKDMARRLGAPESVEGSNGRIEAAGIDLMHFTIQHAIATDIPHIYHPHDLQHLHFPDFFDPEEIARRERVYRYFCKSARMVATVSSWVKSDVVAQYDLPEEKVSVVPFAPPNLGYGTPDAADLKQAIEKFGLPKQFAFYPAQTWKHKNHIRLIEAAARLRESGGADISFVFSGQKNDHHKAIAARATELGFEQNIRFIGFVSPIELQCLYSLARCVVVPSLHEAASFPIWEAFLANTPVACSSVTSLPEQVGEAALLFDPEDVGRIGEALNRIWSDEKLRQDLASRGKKRVDDLNWERTCRHFRAHYRRLLGSPLTSDDQALLRSSPFL
ncbi:glycosyltransferase family 4 protein [Microbulbifer sp. S227A]|uniref:glycosyltransferase family 4 protein n=1 Tax=Microbulbifer sp. S227A TaxID=3415131 RepID=UPI003C7E0559